MSTACSQNSLPVLQAASMDRHLGHGFETPTGSFTFLTLLSVLLLVSLYQTVILPLASWIIGRPVSLSPKTRMGISFVLSILAILMLAITETVRKQRVAAGAPTISAMWMIPYYVIHRLGEGFHVIGQNEFYFPQLPKSMSSVAATLVHWQVSSQASLSLL